MGSPAVGKNPDVTPAWSTPLLAALVGAMAGAPAAWSSRVAPKLGVDALTERLFWETSDCAFRSSDGLSRLPRGGRLGYRGCECLPPSGFSEAALDVEACAKPRSV